MKKSLFIVHIAICVFVFCSARVSASQIKIDSAVKDTTSNKVHTHDEIAIDISQMVFPQRYSFYYRYDPFYNNVNNNISSPGLNLSFRHTMSATTIRARIDVANANMTTKSFDTTSHLKNTPKDTSITEYKNLTSYICARIGVHQNFGYGRANFYAGADAILYNGRSAYESAYETHTPFDDVWYTNKSSSLTTGFGLAPVFGIQYRINKSISLGVEECLIWVRTKTNTEYSNSTRRYIGTPNEVYDIKKGSTVMSADYTNNSPLNNLSVLLLFRF